MLRLASMIMTRDRMMVTRSRTMLTRRLMVEEEEESARPIIPRRM